MLHHYLDLSSPWFHTSAPWQWRGTLISFKVLYTHMVSQQGAAVNLKQPPYSSCTFYNCLSSGSMSHRCLGKCSAFRRVTLWRCGRWRRIWRGFLELSWRGPWIELNSTTKSEDHKLWCTERYWFWATLLPNVDISQIQTSLVTLTPRKRKKASK